MYTVFNVCHILAYCGPQLVASVVEHIVSTAKKVGGILIFMPGVQEIRQCMESIRKIGGAKVFPLHANLSNDEQRAVFAPTQGWKIVVATNVAEVSQWDFFILICA